MHATTESRPSRRPADHVYYSMTKSLCRVCKDAVDAKIIFRDDAVFLNKFCPRHGKQECLIASSVAWYLDCLTFVAPHTPPKLVMTPVSAGCPFDCGPCASHQQKLELPVVRIPSEEPKDQLGRILQMLKKDHNGISSINLAGTDVRQGTDWQELMQTCRDAGIRRLVISADQIGLLEGCSADLELAVTLTREITSGQDEDEIGAMIRLLLSDRRIDTVELQPSPPESGDRTSGRGLTIPDVHRRIEEYTQGCIQAHDFVPSPLAHPHCFSICCLRMLDDGRYVPLARDLGRAGVFEMLQGSLYPRQPEARSIYIHAHMDAESFDVGRVMKCCVGVPRLDGRNVPLCSEKVQGGQSGVSR